MLMPLDCHFRGGFPWHSHFCKISFASCCSYESVVELQRVGYLNVENYAHAAVLLRTV